VAEQQGESTANDTARLEAFSDGVFAIAITLLVLEIRLPGGHRSLTLQLGDLWPSYIAYVLSFVTIGIMWANHHAICRLISRATHGLIVANLLLLMSIGFLPFPTAVLAEHLGGEASDRTAAAVFYSATFVLIAICFQILWQTAARKDRLIVPGREAAANEITKSYRWGVPSYTITTLVALWNPVVSVALVGAMALFWLIPRGRAD
jgi:TMEM175 potassium channel family protein